MSVLHFAVLDVAHHDTLSSTLGLLELGSKGEELGGEAHLFANLHGPVRIIEVFWQKVSTILFQKLLESLECVVRAVSLAGGPERDLLLGVHVAETRVEGK